MVLSGSFSSNFKKPYCRVTEPSLKFEKKIIFLKIKESLTDYHLIDEYVIVQPSKLKSISKNNI